MIASESWPIITGREWVQFRQPMAPPQGSMNENPNLSNRDLYIRLLSYVKPYRKVFGLAILAMLGVAATEPVFPAMMKHLLDNGFQTDDPKMVWLIPLGMIGLFLIRGIFTFCVSYLMMWVSTNLTIDLRREMFAKLLTLPTQVFHDQSAGKLISRLLYDVNSVSEAGTSVLVTIVRETLTALVLLAYLLYLDWALTLATLTLGPVIGWLVKKFSERTRAASRQSLQTLRDISHTIEETVNAQKVVKIFGGQNQQTQRYAGNLAQFRRAFMREAVPSSALTPITHLAASFAVAGITWLALTRTTGGVGTSPGGFISFITALLLLIAPIKQLTTINGTLQRGLAACESIFGLLDSPGEVDHGTVSLKQVTGTIAFENVSFAYPGSDRQALENVSFNIEAGQTVALVGASGGGKTTIGALIPRFYSASSGRITLDGIDLNEIQLASLRQQIALVSQDVVLFNDTLAANIAFGSPADISRQLVEDAARAANAWEFIERLPQGIDTLIGENGAKLSGGQRQRIAIARAILKNAPILILDEATSALDTESERLVQAALASLMKNRTTLVIAHRLSTIEQADKIVVLNQGRIVETGTHAELLSLGGVYANLSRIQT